MSSHLDDLLAILDARELPDPGPDGVPCCESYAIFGSERCTCWEPVFNTEQADPRPELEHATRDRMCADCAFRPGSPERTDSERAIAGSDELLGCVLDERQAFYCHDGLRYGVAMRHPNGLTVPVEVRDGVVAYYPPIIDGRPYRADGTPALHCAGLVAARRAKDWTP